MIEMEGNMEKVIEFNLEEKELKKYLEECLKEENINYEIKIEDRWIQKYQDASNYYQVYCLYVNSNNLNKVEQFINEFENGISITDGVEELENFEDEGDDNRFNFFTKKNLLKCYLSAIIIITILIIIGIKMIA